MTVAVKHERFSLWCLPSVSDIMEKKVGAETSAGSSPLPRVVLWSSSSINLHHQSLGGVWPSCKWKAGCWRAGKEEYEQGHGEEIGRRDNPDCVSSTDLVHPRLSSSSLLIPVSYYWPRAVSTSVSCNRLSRTACYTMLGATSSCRTVWSPDGHDVSLSSMTTPSSG